jgi:hypothetical protein
VLTACGELISAAASSRTTLHDTYDCLLKFLLLAKAYVCTNRVSDLSIALQKTSDCMRSCCPSKLDMLATAQEQCPKGLAAKHWQLCALQLVPELYH